MNCVACARCLRIHTTLATHHHQYQSVRVCTVSLESLSLHVKRSTPESWAHAFPVKLINHQTMAYACGSTPPAHCQHLSFVHTYIFRRPKKPFRAAARRQQTMNICLTHSHACVYKSHCNTHTTGTGTGTAAARQREWQHEAIYNRISLAV